MKSNLQSNLCQGIAPVPVGALRELACRVESAVIHGGYTCSGSQYFFTPSQPFEPSTNVKYRLGWWPSNDTSRACSYTCVITNTESIQLNMLEEPPAPSRSYCFLCPDVIHDYDHVGVRMYDSWEIFPLREIFDAHREVMHIVPWRIHVTDSVVPHRGQRVVPTLVWKERTLTFGTTALLVETD